MNQPFRILHLTDSHHKPGHPQLARAVEVVNAMDPQPDLVVHGGDIINGYCDDVARRQQMADAAAILQDLRPPLLATCCNHDTHGEHVRGTCFACHFSDDWVQEHHHDGWAVLAVSGNVDLPGNLPPDARPEDGTTYRIGENWFLDLLNSWLAEQADRRCVVFTHKPIVPMRGKLLPEDPADKPPPGSLDNYSHRQPTRARFLEILHRHNVAAHYAGHVHFNAVRTVGSLCCVSTSATQSYPGEMRLIECCSDRIEHRMIPVTGGYELWTRWRNTTDPTHPTEKQFYLGLDEEREFTFHLEPTRPGPGEGSNRSR
ncbi:MAG: metallophosphoesterase family protein [Phycisphaerae bacterium]